NPSLGGPGRHIEAAQDHAAEAERMTLVLEDERPRAGTNPDSSSQAASGERDGRRRLVVAHRRRIRDRPVPVEKAGATAMIVEDHDGAPPVSVPGGAHQIAAWRARGRGAHAADENA